MHKKIHLRTILLWKADELDDLTSIFQLCFPWSITFSVISLFQGRIQALFRDYLVDLAAQRFDELSPGQCKKPTGKCKASSPSPFPPLHLHSSALQKHSSVQVQPSPHTGAAKWDRKVSNSLFSPEFMSMGDDVFLPIPQDIFCSNRWRRAGSIVHDM